MKRVIQIALMCVLVAAVAGLCACSQQAQPKQDQAKQDQQTAQEQKPVEVVIPLNAPEFTQDCTNLPVRVVGNETSGKQIEEIVYVDSQGQGINLLPGDYSFAVTASPLAPEGRLFAIPEPGIGITLPEDAEKTGTYEVPSDLAWSFSYLDASQVTKELVEEAYAAALKSPGQEQLAQSLYEGYASITK